MQSCSSTDLGQHFIKINGSSFGAGGNAPYKRLCGARNAFGSGLSGSGASPDRKFPRPQKSSNNGNRRGSHRARPIKPSFSSTMMMSSVGKLSSTNAHDNNNNHVVGMKHDEDMLIGEEDVILEDDSEEEEALAYDEGEDELD